MQAFSKYATLIWLKRRNAMRCPSCSEEMIALEFKDVEVDYCPSCGGCWLDQGELELIVGHLNRQTLPLSSETKGKRPCPHCRKKMQTASLSKVQVEIDFCPHHGLWLDKGELQSVIEAGEATAETSALAAYCKEIFGK
jgi:Zn-finger nucleic acid-binding protein